MEIPTDVSKDDGEGLQSECGVNIWEDEVFYFFSAPETLLRSENPFDLRLPKK
jgi:hypothetical protein